MRECLSVATGLLASAALTLLSGVVSPARASAGPDTLDLFVMSQCPYGVDAEREIIRALDRLERRPVLRLWFIGRESVPPAMLEGPRSWPVALHDAADPDSNLLGQIAGRPSCHDTADGPAPHVPEMDPFARFTSLHGPAEVREDAYQVTIAALWPDRLLRYLELRAESFDDPSAFAATAVRAGLDPAVVQERAESPWGVARLAENLQRARRLDIHASPTLLVNGQEVTTEVRELALVRRLCADEPGDPLCASQPECGTDTDCQEPGLEGRCVSEETRARCVFAEPSPVTLTVVSDDRCSACDVEFLVSQARAIFPGLVVEEMDARSDRGRSLLRSLDLEAVPALVFDSTAVGAPGWRDIAPALVPRGRRFVLNTRLLDASYFPFRDERQETIDLFVAGNQASSARAMDALKDLLRRGGVESNITVATHYVARQDPTHPWVRLYANAGEPGRMDEGSAELVPRFVSARGPDEIAEDQRQLCLRRQSKDALERYHAARADSVRRTGRIPDPWRVLASIGASAAERGPGAGGIDLAALDSCSRGSEGARLLLDAIALSETLDVDMTPAFLVKNRLRLTGLNMATLRALVRELGIDVSLPAARPELESAGNQGSR